MFPRGSGCLAAAGMELEAAGNSNQGSSIPGLEGLGTRTPLPYARVSGEGAVTQPFCPSTGIGSRGWLMPLGTAQQRMGAAGLLQIDGSQQATDVEGNCATGFVH